MTFFWEILLFLILSSVLFFLYPICASYCIVTEAGGKMTDMLGNELTYNNKIVNHNNGILVTNGSFHDTILEEYKKLQ